MSIYLHTVQHLWVRDILGPTEPAFLPRCWMSQRPSQRQGELEGGQEQKGEGREEEMFAK